jgi:hypothetical protein
MWLLIDPCRREGLAESFLQDIQQQKLLYWADDLNFSSCPIFINANESKRFYSRFMSCSYIRLGSRHGQALPPYIAIDKVGDKMCVRYYVGYPDRSRVEMQFAQDLPVFRHLFFTENAGVNRLYIPFGLDEARCEVKIYKDENHDFYILASE